ncbi:MAG: CvpA family protein [Pseudomonadota bacterium]
MIIDLIVAAVAIVSAIISFLRGFIRETLTIAGMVGGLFMAYAFGDNLSPVFRDWFGVDPEAETPAKLFDIVPMTIVADACAYGFIFILFVIVISVISYFLGTAIKAMGLGPVDRTFGVIFGIARAVLVLGLLYLPFHLLMEPEDKTEFFKDSKTFPLIEKTSEFMAEFLPSSDEVEETIENVDEESIKQKLFENNFLPGQDKPAEEDAEQPDSSGYESDNRNQLETLMEEASEADSAVIDQPIY